MGDRVDVNTFANSQCAIRDYMHFKLENEYMHEARVLISSMRKTRYNDILKVVPRIIVVQGDAINVITIFTLIMLYIDKRKEWRY